MNTHTYTHIYDAVMHTGKAIKINFNQRKQHNLLPTTKNIQIIINTFQYTHKSRTRAIIMNLKNTLCIITLASKRNKHPHNMLFRLYKAKH